MKGKTRATEFATSAAILAPPIVHEVVHSPGQVLEPATRALMETRFAHDLSQVRVHADPKAAKSAWAVDAQAYTVGHHIAFSNGRYQPNSDAGRRLLAHELVHVVQQATGQTVPSDLRIGSENDSAEFQAKNIAAGCSDLQEPLARSTSGVLRRVPIYEGRILDEGTCADLVAGSSYICCDPEGGTEREGKKVDVDGKSCPSEKFTPIFTCDGKCPKALEKGCQDDDAWMALPHSRFSRRKCDQDLVICANGKSTHGYVRDRSEREAWEVSRAIPAALGVKPDFRGAVYGSENDPNFKKDKRCQPQTGSSGPKSKPPEEQSKQKPAAESDQPVAIGGEVISD